MNIGEDQKEVIIEPVEEPQWMPLTEPVKEPVPA